MHAKRSKFLACFDDNSPAGVLSAKDAWAPLICCARAARMSVIQKWKGRVDAKCSRAPSWLHMNFSYLLDEHLCINVCRYGPVQHAWLHNIGPELGRGWHGKYMEVKASKTDYRLWFSKLKWLREEARVRYRKKYKTIQWCVCSYVVVI